MAIALLLVCPLPLSAHLALRSASPALQETLEAPPRELQLTFTEPLEPGLSRVELWGPRGRVALGTLEPSLDRTGLRAAVVGIVEGGSYLVRWTAVGRDGHPVRGEIPFTVLGGDASETGVPGSAPGLSPDPGGGALPFEPGTRLLGGIRWIGYLGLLGSLGAVGMLLLLRSVLREGSADLAPPTAASVTRRTAGAGSVAALLLLGTLPLRIMMHSHAIFGEPLDPERLQLLLGTRWGVGWALQFLGAAALLGGLLIARRGRLAGVRIALVGGIAAAAAPGLSGHPAGAAMPFVAGGLSMIHILGVGLWLGTLLILAIVVLPALDRHPAADLGTESSLLLHAFSRTAGVTAPLVAISGAGLAVLLIPNLGDLWGSEYGTTFLAKLALVLVVLALGGLNRARLGRRPPDRRISRTLTLEVVVAIGVLGTTAMLVGTPPPVHRGDVPAMSGPASPPTPDLLQGAAPTPADASTGQGVTEARERRLYERST